MITDDLLVKIWSWSMTEAIKIQIATNIVPISKMHFD